jgi:phage shock protein PspC (stress-responsive transcriptional regulator)
MVVIMFFVLIALAIYAGIFVGALAYRTASLICDDKRDPEAIKRWDFDRRYSRLLMGSRKV